MFIQRDNDGSHQSQIPDAFKVEVCDRNCGCPVAYMFWKEDVCCSSGQDASMSASGVANSRRKSSSRSISGIGNKSISKKDPGLDALVFVVTSGRFTTGLAVPASRFSPACTNTLVQEMNCTGKFRSSTRRS